MIGCPERSTAQFRSSLSSFLLLERHGSGCCRRGGGGSSGGGSSSGCCERLLPRGRAQRLKGCPAPRGDVAFELRAVGLGEDLVGFGVRVKVRVRVRVGGRVGVGNRVGVGVRGGVRVRAGVRVGVRVRVSPWRRPLCSRSLRSRSSRCRWRVGRRGGAGRTPTARPRGVA